MPLGPVRQPDDMILLLKESTEEKMKCLMDLCVCVRVHLDVS